VDPPLHGPQEGIETLRIGPADVQARLAVLPEEPHEVPLAETPDGHHQRDARHGPEQERGRAEGVEPGLPGQEQGGAHGDGAHHDGFLEPFVPHGEPGGPGRQLREVHDGPVRLAQGPAGLDFDPVAVEMEGPFHLGQLFAVRA